MISTQNRHIFICSGEASGDLLAGNLAQSILNINPSIKISGVGGTQMRAVGAELILDISTLGFIGIFELLKHIKVIRHTIKTIKQHLKKNRPGLVVLVDYPGLNLHIARYAKKLGLKVLFYVSPQIWAWRYGRIKRIRRDVDHMAVLYQFEEALYRRENVPVTCVGHPLKQLAKASLDKAEIYKILKLSPERPIVALFPGSRDQEIKKLLPIILDATKQIRAAIPDVQFALPLAQTIDKAHMKTLLPPDISLIENNTYNLLAITDAAIAASGTATLEIGLMNVPLVVLYKIAAPTYWLLNKIITMKHYALCNIISEKSIAKEFIQQDATADNIARETVKLVLDETYRRAIKEKMHAIQDGLGGNRPAEKVAATAFELLV